MRFGSATSSQNAEGSREALDSASATPTGHKSSRKLFKAYFHHLHHGVEEPPAAITDSTLICQSTVMGG
jgi:hypothetical protein